MKAHIYTITHPGPGTLSTMARPRGGDWLDEEMVALRAAGVDVVVSMLTSAECRELELDGEADAAKRAGLQFVGLPTPDRGTPDVQEFRALLSLVGNALRRTQHVVVHCRMGIGRASLVAAGVLISEGVPSTDAWSSVAAARGLSVPDTPAQRAWLDAVLTF